MKKTIMPTKFEYIRFIYIYGILKILLFTAILTFISFLGLAAVLSSTDFNERYLGDSVLVLSVISLVLGNVAGTFLHRYNIMKSTYFIKDSKIKLYLICNCIYTVIIYLMVLAVM